MEAFAPAWIGWPVKAGSNQRFDLYVFTDDRLKTKNTSLSTTNGWRAVVTNPSASTVGYALTASSFALGRFYFLLTGSSHTATGTHGISVFKTGTTRGRFEFAQV